MLHFALALLWMAGLQSPPGHLEQGLLALKDGDLKRAQTELEQAGSEDPNNAYVWTSLAETYLRAGSVEKATQAAAKAEKTGAGNPIVSHALAMFYSETSEFRQAAEHERTYAASGKADPDATSRAAMLFLRAEDFAAAAELAETGLRARPRDPQLTLTLGVARYGQRRFEDATVSFLQVIQIDPDIEQPYIFLGKMLDQAGAHLPEITPACRRWLERSPENAKAHLVLAKALLAHDSRSTEAAGLLERAIALDPNDWESHYELGVLLAARRDYARAERELSRSIELDAKQAMPHYHLARVYDRLNQPERARAEREIHQRLTGPAPAH